MLNRFIYFTHQNVNSATTGESESWFGEAFRTAFIDFVKWITNGIFDTLTPFVEWGCKIFIVWCVVLLYCSGEKKNISSGLKCLLIYIIFFLIKGALT